MAMLCLALVIGGGPGLALGSSEPSGVRQTAFIAQEGLAGDVIVVLEEDAGLQAAEAVDLAVDVSGEEPVHVFDTAIDGFSATLTAAEVVELAQDPGVAAIIPDTPIYAAAQTLPTGVNRIDADENPVANIDGSDQRVNADVAVLDAGIFADADINLAGGVDCFGKDGDTGNFTDAASGHGTHVSGTIGAIDNGSGVVGVAPGARIWAVKVLEDGERGLSGNLSDLICGLDWVLEHAGTIDVVNMSLTGTGSDGSCTDPGLRQAVCNVAAAGVALVAAAGNASMDVTNVIPATYPEVIAVSGINDSDGQPTGDTRYNQSNFGADIDIAAPAVGILSTVGGGSTSTKTGTSMAAAHVSGAIALSRGGWGGNIFETARFPGEPGGVNGVPEGVLCVGSCGGAQNPAIALDRSRSTVNVPVRVSISGFPSNVDVTVAFVGTSYPSTATVRTNAGGAATAFVTVPATPQGRYSIRATSGGITASAPFEVAPRIKVTPTSGAPGDTVGVSLRGFGKRDSVRIRWKVGSSYVTLTTVITSNSGSSNVSVQVPRSAPDGPTSVRGDGTIARAQTNAFVVEGGNLRAAAEPTPAGSPVASPIVASPGASPVAEMPAGSPVAVAEEPTLEATATVSATVHPPTEVPTEVPTETPTETSTEIPTEIPTETPAPTPTPEITPYPILGDASSDPNVPGWLAYDGEPQTYWEVAAPALETAEPTGEGTPRAVIEPALGPDGLPLPVAFLVLDLGAWMPIGTVRWLFAVEGGADDLRIEVSEDGVFWTPITYPGQVGNALPGEWQALPLVPGTVGGRYVRFAFENPNGDPMLGGMAEIDVLP